MIYVKYLLILFVFSFSGTVVAKADTITNQQYLINTSTKESILSLYDNSISNFYVLTSKREQNGYNTYTYYYLCLSSEIPDSFDSMNIKLKCDKYYTIFNNTVSTAVNVNLTINNSFYDSNISTVAFWKRFTTFSCIILLCLFIYYCMFNILLNWLHSKGGGIKIE